MRAAVLMLAASAAWAAPEVAVVTDLKGTVERQPGETQGWKVAWLDEALHLLDFIRTGARSKTEMRFVDRTVLAVGEKTRLRISLALFDVRAAPPEIRLALLDGRIDVEVHRTAMPLVVEAPTGEPVTLAPGRRARLRVVDGKIVVEAVPEGFRFAADFEDDWWLDAAPGRDALLPNLGPGDAPTGSDDVPGALDPIDDDRVFGGDRETGVELRLDPREGGG